ncbi:MAG: glycosyltransferase [Bacteroidia bacterium]|nr:glycosyltransferase [Bacteroidia bacterium]
MLSIILPSYNGSNTLKKQLPLFISYLNSTSIRYELVIVDDGSDDHQATQELANLYHCRFVRLPHNSGKGAAVKAGILAATGSEILFTDADIPFAYENYIQFYRAICSQQNAMVVGDRHHPQSNYFSETTPLRKLVSYCFSLFVKSVAGLHDTQCGLKGFSRNTALTIFKDITVNGFAFDVELFLLAAKNNFEVKRLPVQLRSQQDSSVKVVGHGLEMMYDLIKIKGKQLRGKYTHKTN